MRDVLLTAKVTGLLEGSQRGADVGLYVVLFFAPSGCAGNLQRRRGK